MALATYSDLKASIVNFAGRDDLTQTLDDFIDMTEESIYSNTEQPLRIRSMETRETLTGVAGSRFLALPDGHLETRVLLVLSNGERQEMKYVVPAALSVQPTTGTPHYFTVTDQIEFDRPMSSGFTFEIQFYKKPTPLSSTNQTNAVLTNYPSIYLMGALSYMHELTGEEELSARYYQKFMRAIRGAVKGDRQGRYGPTPAGRVQGSIV